MSGWLTVRQATKEDWKSVSVESGEQFVTTTLTTLMLALSATVLDSGSYCHHTFLCLKYRVFYDFMLYVFILLF